MNELTDLVLRHQSIAVVGMGKNTGKTVTVNCLVVGVVQTGISLGLTSTGRDGESTDIVSALPKPAIYLPEKAVLATSTASLGRGTARLEILDTTGIYNALGEIVIARVRETGSVEISGPERTGDLRAVIARLQDYAQLVIADGAIDRIAASAPSVTDAAILATGAVIGRDVQKVVGLTVHAARVLMTPVVSNLGEQGLALLEQGKIGVQNQHGQVKQIPLTTAIDAPPEIFDYLSPEYNCLLVGGALSDPLAELLLQASWKVQGLKAVVQDGTRIFVEPGRWQRLLRRVDVNVVRPINLIAITVNPVDPRGRRLPGRQLVGGLRELMPELLVVDPMAEGG
ncbi:MAG: hypothetical protein PHD92_07510 [Eubacteriales bacterium]|nr:hypothetical protein [Eubacteriales bacterium]